VIRSSGVQVMVVENQPGSSSATIHFRTVKLGRDYGATVEVADGLIDGTTVVLNPNADLVDGSRVRIMTAALKPASSSGVPK
jgi:hypothetical protein